jgi:GntR family transcriptional regulator
MTTDPRAYVRLAAILRAEIRDGIIPPDAPLPSIGELRRKHGHSRQTAGKALHILEREKLVHRVVGLGYYTTSPDE